MPANRPKMAIPGKKESGARFTTFPGFSGWLNPRFIKYVFDGKDTKKRPRFTPGPSWGYIKLCQSDVVNIRKTRYICIRNHQIKQLCRLEKWPAATNGARPAKFIQQKRKRKHKPAQSTLLGIVKSPRKAKRNRELSEFPIFPYLCGVFLPSYRQQRYFDRRAVFRGVPGRRGFVTSNLALSSGPHNQPRFPGCVVRFRHRSERRFGPTFR